MTDAAPFTFDAFFEALWGRPPFAWQRALAQRVLAANGNGNGDIASPQRAWPEAIALPTASGKTACIDIAVFALAAQADRLERAMPLSAPRRIFFVVDRRVIVDEALDRARAIADRLRQARSGVLHEVAQNLCLIGGGDVPLLVQSLRGGQARSDDWAASPLQPSVVASTVDQVGSRLMFRGYGVSPGMWPVHAGMVGNDALILLDEAHCAQPMLETLQAVRRYRGWAAQPLPSPFELAVLSATPPAGLTDVFNDDSPERRDPQHPLGRRQLAAKPARLVLAEKAKGNDPAKLRSELAARLAQEALQLAGEVQAGDNGAPALVVFCNRVDTARRVHALLAGEGHDATLLTGRMRPIDKDDTVNAELAPLSTAAAATRKLPQPRFVVATQTLEVGADLDFDLLVSECASLDALRQRFGRLNRGGRAIDARAVIVAPATVADEGHDDPVYGTAIGATWRQLQAWADEHSQVDFGIAALEPLLPADDALRALCAPSAQAPVLLPSHLDALAQTAPAPEPSPEVALFLHGPRSGAGDVQVCWRADLPIGAPEAGLDALIRCPPTSLEMLSVPYIQLRRWLDGSPTEAGADIEGEALADPRDRYPPTPRLALRWRGRKGSETLAGGGNLRPGDVLVIPAALGGLDELATLGPSPTADWGDRANAALRGNALLRLHPKVLAQWPAAGRTELDWLAQTHDEKIQTAWNEDPAEFGARLKAALAQWADAMTDPQSAWLRDLVRLINRRRRLDRHLSLHPCGGWIIDVPKPREKSHSVADSATAAFFSDADDPASSGHFRSTLVEPMTDGRSHLQGVGMLARHYAKQAGLAREMRDAIGMAADGHDLGKADPRFQAWLRNGVPWAGGPLLAKSAEMPQSREASVAARLRARYPEGGRHELLSVRLLESCPAVLPTDADLRELALHLVESHHGHCRPFAPVVHDAEPLRVAVESAGQRFEADSNTGLERLDAGPADRYWQLTRRHGWWGLVWLEALLRLADHRRSAWEQQQDGDRA